MSANRPELVIFSADMSAAPSKLLNLGCGAHFHPAWTNVDIAPADSSVQKHDLAKPLPFADGSFAAVYHSHVLEHLPRHRALPFLKECHRVLAPRGFLRVVVPDLEAVVTLYLENLRGALAGDPVCRQRYEWLTVELLDQMTRHHPDGGEMFKYLLQEPIPALDFVTERFGHEITSKLDAIHGYARQGVTPKSIDDFRNATDSAKVGEFRLSGEVHQWMYDRYSLGKLLEQSGFTDIAMKTGKDSDIPDFSSYHLDVLPDGSVRKPDSLFMEAKKS